MTQPMKITKNYEDEVLFTDFARSNNIELVIDSHERNKYCSYFKNLNYGESEDMANTLEVKGLGTEINDSVKELVSKASGMYFRKGNGNNINKIPILKYDPNWDSTAV